MKRWERVYHVVAWAKGGPDDGPQIICNPLSVLDVDCRLRVQDGQVFLTHPNLFSGAEAVLVFEETRQSRALAYLRGVRERHLRRGNTR